MRRAGQLTGHGDDLFFLELQETFDLLRGCFDPIRWAADPDRRGDYYD